MHYPCLITMMKKQSQSRDRAISDYEGYRRDMLDVQNLTKTYGLGPVQVKALDRVSFKVATGDMVCIRQGDLPSYGPIASSVIRRAPTSRVVTVACPSA